MTPVKVLIIDDSAFYRRSIAEILKKDLRFVVMKTVGNGSEAIQFMAKERPDVITLDLEMPVMDGFTFLRWVMSNRPIPVVVISSRSEGPNILKSLELGAVDFIVKPSDRASMDILNQRSEIVTKLANAAAISGEKLKIQSVKSYGKTSGETHVDRKSQGSGPVKVVAIGASTGGPPAIQSIIFKLSKGFPAAVVVAQHMPPGFTLYFAERLDKSSNLPVKEAEAGDLVEAGKVYIAPGGKHLFFHPFSTGVEIRLKPSVASDKYSPSVDLMMTSAAKIFGKDVMGVILTGMGSDGKEGMKMIKNCGGITLAESKETSIVFGMPNEVIKSGVVEKVLPIHKMADEVLRRCMSLKKDRALDAMAKE